MRFIDAQTQLVDLFLAELAYLDNASEPINFNNTNQFHSLLRSLENALGDPILQPPSTNVLHILITLASRCPKSNWTHDITNGDDGIEVSSLYMREVNTRYEHSLRLDLLSQRSVNVLRHYILILNKDEWDESTQRLHLNLFHVINLLCGGRRSSKLEFKPESAPEPEPVELNPVAEVIDDSESDTNDDQISITATSDLVSKYSLFNVPARSVISLSELSNKTSGLGETALLFRDMPHLLAHATPEPDSEPRSPEKPKPKKAKVRRDPLEFLMVYDNHILAKTLNPAVQYGLWDLLRWALLCCDQSSEYQQFLFNSSTTALHSIWVTYEAVFDIIFSFIHIQFKHGLLKNAVTLFLNLKSPLGSKIDQPDRLVAYVFTGLKDPVKDKPFPVYQRERMLIKNDPVTQMSRYKSEPTQYTDNHSSMRLRAFIIAMYYLNEADLEQGPIIIEQMVRKLNNLGSSFFVEFLDKLRAYSSEESVVEKLYFKIISGLLRLVISKESSQNHLFRDLDNIKDKVDKACELLCDSRMLHELVTHMAFFTAERFIDELKKRYYLLRAYANVALHELLAQRSPTDGTIDLFNRFVEAANDFDHIVEKNLRKYVRSQTKKASAYNDADVEVIEVEEVGFNFSEVDAKDLVKFAKHYRRFSSYKTEVSLKNRS